MAAVEISCSTPIHDTSIVDTVHERYIIALWSLKLTVLLLMTLRKNMEVPYITAANCSIYYLRQAV